MNLLTIKEAANFLRMNVSWMRKAVRTKQIPYYKIGKFIKFSEDDLIKFINKSKIPADNYQQDEKVIDIFQQQRSYEKMVD